MFCSYVYPQWFCTFGDEENVLLYLILKHNNPKSKILFSKVKKHVVS